MKFLYDQNLAEFYELPHNNKFNIDRQNINNYDKHILKVVLHYCKALDITKKVEIEYEIINNINNFEIDQSNDKHPLLTLISFLDLQSHSILQSDIDDESYKYKDIQDKNTLCICIPNKSTFVSINSSKYYTVFSPNQECYYLKINVWEGQELYDIDSDIEVFEDISTETKIQKNININSNETFEDIVYNTMNEDSLNILKSFVDNLEIINNTVINIQFIVGHNYDINRLENEYGDITFDLLDVIKGNLISSNRFYSNKIIQKMYSLDVCYWIINECIKSKLWKVSNVNNYDYIINAEEISHIFNFIIFSSNIWLNYFKKIYDISDNIKINISDIYVAKNIQKQHCGYLKEEEKQHFECIVRLNDEVDANGGSIIVNDNIFNLHQGDMFVYNSLHKRQDELLITGEIFYLVFNINVLF